MTDLERAAKWLLGELDGDGTFGPDAVAALRAALAAQPAQEAVAWGSFTTDMQPVEIGATKEQALERAHLLVDGDFIAVPLYTRPTPPAQAPEAVGDDPAALKARLAKIADCWIESVKALLPAKRNGPITGGHIDTDVPPGRPA